jgi:hypothetical protein
MIQLALYKHRRPLTTVAGIGAALIRWWTRSEYSHCELVVDGMCFSSSIQDGGVRAKAIELRSDRWDWIDLPWASRDAIVAHWYGTLRQPYDWWGLIGSQIFNRRAHYGDASFCSEWCAAALELSHPQTYSPQTLADYCRSRRA